MHRASAKPTLATSVQIAPAAVVSARPSPWFIAGAACGLAAAWLAAGSTGLIAHGLRHALTWLLLGGAIVLAWPRGTKLWERVSMVAAIVAAVLMTASPIQAVNLFAAPLVLAALAVVQRGSSRRVMLLCAKPRQCSRSSVLLNIQARRSGMLVTPPLAQSVMRAASSLAKH